MTKRQIIEKREKETRRTLKKCEIAKRYVSCGFTKTIIINRNGQCAGCYDPDAKELEQQCKKCKCNEYFSETVF